MYILQECVGLSLGYVRLVLVLQSTPIFKYDLTSNNHRLGSADDIDPWSCYVNKSFISPRYSQQFNQKTWQKCDVALPWLRDWLPLIV